MLCPRLLASRESRLDHAGYVLFGSVWQSLNPNPKLAHSQDDTKVQTKFLIVSIPLAEIGDRAYSSKS